jgi:competence protein ComEC
LQWDNRSVQLPIAGRRSRAGVRAGLAAVASKAARAIAAVGSEAVHAAGELTPAFAAVASRAGFAGAASRAACVAGVVRAAVAGGASRAVVTRAVSAALGGWAEAEHDRLALWLPVAMGAGTALYFAQAQEPPAWAGVAAMFASLAALAPLRRRPLGRWPALLALAAAAGFTSGQAATWRALPLAPLPTRAAAFTGTIAAIDPLPQGRRVVLTGAQTGDDAAPLARSLRIRLRDADPVALADGDTIRLRALVRPPSMPAYPGAWDLQRDAFYAGIAGYGYALGDAEVLAHAPPAGLAAWGQGVPDAVAARILAVLPGAVGGIAATLLTGNPAAIPPADRAAFRDSGLAHLLAVAGLHIGIVMGLVFALTRLLLALWEHAALHWPARQIAGLAALAAGFGYMLLTGMHLPIERSFAMACLVTLGLLAGRRAVSLRGLGLAATVLLLATPEALTGVSFQMSFSAVLALIAGYEALRPWLARLRGPSALRGVALHVLMLALTSLLAGTASAPFAAYHFGHVQLYFILANVAAVPLTAFWVMPAGLAALTLMPLGLERPALLAMGWGVQGLLWIGRTVSALPAATLTVAHMPLWGLLAVALGLAWLGLWRTPVRLAGVAGIALGLVSPALTTPADILVSADARLIALRTPSGLLVQARPGGDRFVLDAWRQYWGLDVAGVFPDAPEAGADCAAQSCLLRPHAGAAAVLARAGGPVACGDAAVLISAEPVRAPCAAVALVDRFTVWREGAQAIWLGPDGARVLSDRAVRGDRPWVPRPPAAAARARVVLPMAARE